MCGIVGGFVSERECAAGLLAIAHRGPDASGVLRVGDLRLGHARLAILDLDPRSNQPFRYGRTAISFNGEIWNYLELRKALQEEGCRFATTGDTEVLAAALDRWGIDALARINGMMAVAWTRGGKEVFLARDRFGEMPLHYARSSDGFWFASERKALAAMNVEPASVFDVPPGGVVKFSKSSFSLSAYYDLPTAASDFCLEEAAVELKRLVERGSAERAISDVPACVLISGGIDSAAIALSLKAHVPGLVGYTASMNEKSRDLRCARVVAEAVGISLVEVKVPSPTMNDLRETVRVIEMPSKAQVEIGWPCLKLAEAMKADGFKVTFSGEGSDELWASYGFAYHALKTEDWHLYRKELFLTQARKNFPRANKAFMSRGIECRLPFLHPSSPEFAISLRRAAVQLQNRPKAIIQEAFRGFLPDEIVNRPKLAFQDGTGMKVRAAEAVDVPVKFYREEFERMYLKRRSKTLWS